MVSEEVGVSDALDDAIEQYKPAWVFALVSGGHDSASMLHYVRDRISAAVHIDTGTGIPETRAYVDRLCVSMGIKLLVYEAANATDGKGNPEPQVYADIVRQHGFPGPAQHRIMYSKLKERPLRMLLREHAGVKLLVTGVRSSESARRMGFVAPIKVETGNKIWVAPCHDWDVDRQNEYMAVNSIPRNPVKDTLGMSGECLCGAYAKPGELDRLRAYCPEIAARIEALEQEVIVRDRKFTWGWGEKPPRFASKNQMTLDMDFIPVMCIGCESKL